MFSKQQARSGCWLGVPLIGTAAAIGLILFFVGAIFTHLRVRDYSFGLAVVFLLLAVAFRDSGTGVL